MFDLERRHSKISFIVILKHLKLIASVDFKWILDLGMKCRCDCTLHSIQFSHWLLTAPSVLLWYVCKLVAPTAVLWLPNSLTGSCCTTQGATSALEVNIGSSSGCVKCVLYLSLYSVCSVFVVCMNTTGGQQNSEYNSPLKSSSHKLF